MLTEKPSNPQSLYTLGLGLTLHSSTASRQIGLGPECYPLRHLLEKMFPDLHSLQVSGYYRPFRIFKVQQRKLKLLPAISPSLSLGLLLSHPLALKAAPTGCGFAFGDLLTQYFNRDQSVSFSEQYKVERGLSMMLIGVMAVGPTLLHFNR